MTSPQTAQGGMQQHQFGTLSVVGWAGDYGDGRDMAFLLIFPFGDGPGSREETAAAMRQLVADLGLSVGGELVDATEGGRQSRVTALVEGGQVALRMPKMSVQYATPPRWIAAAQERGHLYLLVATQPWSHPLPEKEIGEEALRAFVSDEMLATSAHCLLPVMRVAR
ncbi:DUF5949 family protein [Streptomyces sp. PU-14G]|uniref:DUF5949 family protein n=1 Tax=Streptomyces sp. PU-14G TaxID=2800808 RepID=UPI0034E05477